MAADTGKSTILIVDDEPEIREILTIHAGRYGYETIEAEDGQRALETMRSRRIDVVVSDIMMPRLSGLQLLRALRDEGFDCPFIFVTAYPSKEATVEALRLGAFDFIEKPFESDSIVKILAEAVRVAKAREMLVLKPDLGSKTRPDGKLLSDTERKILALGTLRFQPQFEISAFDQKEAERRRMLELFQSESIPQLVFAEASVNALSDIDARSWELGYLFRVMQGIRVAAEAIQLVKIEKFSKALEAYFSVCRVRPSMISPQHIVTLRQAIPGLSDMISVAASPTPMGPDTAEIEAKVAALNLEIASPRS